MDLLPIKIISQYQRNIRRHEELSGGINISSDERMSTGHNVTAKSTQSATIRNFARVPFSSIDLRLQTLFCTLTSLGFVAAKRPKVYLVRTYELGSQLSNMATVRPAIIIIISHLCVVCALCVRASVCVCMCGVWSVYGARIGKANKFIIASF